MRVTLPFACACLALFCQAQFHTATAEEGEVTAIDVTANSNYEDCIDYLTPDGYSCEQQKLWGKCDSIWMRAARYCEKTCGYCGAQSPPIKTEAPDYTTKEKCRWDGVTYNHGLFLTCETCRYQFCQCCDGIWTNCRDSLFGNESPVC